MRLALPSSQLLVGFASSEHCVYAYLGKMVPPSHNIVLKSSYCRKSDAVGENTCDPLLKVKFKLPPIFYRGTQKQISNIYATVDVCFIIKFT